MFAATAQYIHPLPFILMFGSSHHPRLSFSFDALGLGYAFIKVLEKM